MACPRKRCSVRAEPMKRGYWRCVLRLMRCFVTRQTTDARGVGGGRVGQGIRMSSADNQRLIVGAKSHRLTIYGIERTKEGRVGYVMLNRVRRQVRCIGRGRWEFIELPT